MNSNPFRFTNRHIVFIVIAIAWALIVFNGVPYLLDHYRPPNNDVINGIGRGGRLMNLLLPARAERGERMISIYNDGRVFYWSPQDNGVFATVSEYLPITLAEWQAVEILRGQWCQPELPQYPSADTGTPIYKVGWTCDGGRSARRVQVPATLLPPALQTLVDSAPLK